jgi:hypothetical protein
MSEDKKVTRFRTVWFDDLVERGFQRTKNIAGEIIFSSPSPATNALRNLPLDLAV